WSSRLPTILPTPLALRRDRFEIVGKLFGSNALRLAQTQTLLDIQSISLFIHGVLFGKLVPRRAVWHENPRREIPLFQLSLLLGEYFVARVAQERCPSSQQLAETRAIYRFSHVEREPQTSTLGYIHH